MNIECPPFVFQMKRKLKADWPNGWPTSQVVEGKFLGEKGREREVKRNQRN